MNLSIKIFKLLKELLNVTILFWVIETSYFLIKYGWHTKAINNAEKTCDQIVGVCLNISVFLFSISVYRVMNYLINKEDLK